MKFRKVVPVFLAADENYLPFASVTLRSIINRADKKNEYRVYILHAGETGENANLVLSMQTENVRVEFVDVAHKANRIKSVMRCRDYYTSAIYFRLFIPEMFPEFDKAIYIDCDTVLLEDIAKLYDEELGENYVGAVADQAVASVEVFKEYTKNALDILAEEYFNSGVLVLNLKALRAIPFFEAFYGILSSYDFVVAPDQDCLNLICKNKTRFLDAGWNAMPIRGETEVALKLVHYNLTMKPWHYEGILYEEYFWKNARQTPFYAHIQSCLKAFSKEDKMRDNQGGARLLALAKKEADSPDNYARGAKKRAFEKCVKNQKQGRQVWI